MYHISDHYFERFPKDGVFTVQIGEYKTAATVIRDIHNPNRVHYKNHNNEDSKEVLATTPPIKRTHTMNKFPTFREVYNNCLTSGIATSESTSIHIQRSVTTMNPLASQYIDMVIKVVVSPENYTDNISTMARKWFPYGFFSHSTFIGFSTPEKDDSVPEIVININSNNHEVNFTYFVIRYLDNPSTNGFISELKQHEFSPPISVCQIKSIGADGCISREEYDYNPDDTHESHIEFYPFLRNLYPEVKDTEFSIEHIVKDFMNSKSNLLLLVGPAGTAKSTLIRSFIRSEHEVLVIANAQVLESPVLPNTFRNSPKNSNKKMVTIYEDADVFVLPRENGNLALSSMLNQLDGVLGSKEKFIISTNLESLSKVDKALMRPGRCHKVMQFRELRGDEINKAREAVGKPHISTVGNLTLSETLNYTEGQTCPRKAPVFGFISNQTKDVDLGQVVLSGHLVAGSRT